MIQAAVAEPLLRALYGQKWVEAIPLVQLISVGLAFDVFSWPACSLLQSRGQFRTLFLWAGAYATIFMASVVVGATYYQSQGAAIAVCSFYVILSPALVVWVFRSSNVSWNEITNLYLRPICVALLSASGAIGAIRMSAIFNAPPLIQCGLGLLAGPATMGIAARLIMSSSWHDIVARLRQAFPTFALSRN
jgi:O-antigen/teichoic acid export membrane protein